MLRIVEASADLPVTLALAKQHCNVEHDDDDSLIAAYLRAAVQTVEKATTRALSPTVYEWRLDAWPCGDIELPVAPVRSVLSVSYIDEAGDEQTLAAEDWDWEPPEFGATIMFDSSFTAPVLGRDRGGVRIGFDAGYDIPGAADSPADPNLAQPAAAATAVMILTQHWYENRAPVSVGDAVATIPFSAERLIASIRIWR